MPTPRMPATGGTRKINIALQGGGSHGAFAWGVLDKILEDGRLEIDGVSATSAGAMNAAVLGYGMLTGGRDGARALLEKFWSEISKAGQRFSPVQKSPFDDMLKMFGMKDSLSFQMFEAMTRMFSPYQLNPFNKNPLRDVLTATVDFDRLRKECGLRLNICATNVRTGGVRIFTQNEVTADAVLASACLPQLFRAVEIDGENYWDGGYMGNPALFPLIYNTTTSDIIIVHINPIIRTALPTTPPEIFNRVNEISFNSSLIRELRAVAFVTKLIDEDWIKDEHKTKLRRMHIHAIRADSHMEAYSVASKFQTDWPFLTGLRDAGRIAAADWLLKHEDKVGKESSVDIQKEYFS
jgi:NTE family protein